MSRSKVSAKLLKRLRTIPIFEHVQGDELSDVAALMTQRSVPSGYTLVTEGEAGDEMFILLEGRVRISKMTLDQDRYTVAVLDSETTPFFGELALLDQDRRSATIETVEDSELLVLSREDFDRFGDEHPRVGLAIVRALARRVSEHLRHANEDALLLFEALVGEVRSKAEA